MSLDELGALEKVDLKTVWPHEASDFTPWLAEEENLKLLGDTLKIELELEAQEKGVGPFRADILCKDTDNDHWVLIENQLERTNHKHLGQLLTYAAGLQAATIVWVADHFTDEHRAALDWLNDITDDRFNFFGLEIELWQIGESLVAPKFNVVCKPNDWTKGIHPVGELSETRLMQLEYCEGLRELLLERKSVVSPRKPRPQHWTTFRLGRSNCHMSVAVNGQRRRIRCSIVLTGEHRLERYRNLAEQKNAIEEEVGFPLMWRELPDKKSCIIEVDRNDQDFIDRKAWATQHEWLADRLESFYKSFSHRVKAFASGGSETEEVDDTE